MKILVSPHSHLTCYGFHHIHPGETWYPNEPWTCISLTANRACIGHLSLFFSEISIQILLPWVRSRCVFLSCGMLSWRLTSGTCNIDLTCDLRSCRNLCGKSRNTSKCDSKVHMCIKSQFPPRGLFLTRLKGFLGNQEERGDSTSAIDILVFIYSVTNHIVRNMWQSSCLLLKGKWFYMSVSAAAWMQRDFSHLCHEGCLLRGKTTPRYTTEFSERQNQYSCVVFQPGLLIRYKVLFCLGLSHNPICSICTLCHKKLTTEMKETD